MHLNYPGDDLLTPFERCRALPIGNLTSQLFANVYVDRFDHFVAEVLRAPYLRYVVSRVFGGVVQTGRPARSEALVRLIPRAARGGAATARSSRS